MATIRTHPSPRDGPLLLLPSPRISEPAEPSPRPRQICPPDPPRAPSLFRQPSASSIHGLTTAVWSVERRSAARLSGRLPELPTHTHATCCVRGRRDRQAVASLRRWLDSYITLIYTTFFRSTRGRFVGLGGFRVCVAGFGFGKRPKCGYLYWTLGDDVQAVVPFEGSRGQGGQVGQEVVS